MKILHTSDWHIGKRLLDRDRLKEQDEVLTEIETICNDQGVELLLVAGDVFDTFVPSAEAEELFFRHIKSLSKGRIVVLISGNHDDGVRLAACAPFASDGGVYIFGNKPSVMPLGEHDGMRIAEAGENYIVVENKKGEKVYINALPYPNEARLKEDKSDETYAEKTERWIKRGEAGYRGDMPYILLAHVFAAGGRVSESERDIDLGGARAVPLSSFPQNAYIALGHLHRRQKVGENGLYSGAILQYAFDEANTQKSVTLLETEGNAVKIVKEIPLTAGKTLVRLECNGVEEALSLLPRYQDHFVELTLNLRQPLTASMTQALRECNAGLVSLVTRVGSQEEEYIPARAALSPSELFSLYYRSVFQNEPPADILTAFLEMVKENDETDQS